MWVGAPAYTRPSGSLFAFASVNCAVLISRQLQTAITPMTTHTGNCTQETEVAKMERNRETGKGRDTDRISTSSSDKHTDRHYGRNLARCSRSSSHSPSHIITGPEVTYRSAYRQLYEEEHRNASLSELGLGTEVQTVAGFYKLRTVFNCQFFCWVDGQVIFFKKYGSSVNTVCKSLYSV